MNKAVVASGGVTSLLALKTGRARALEIRYVEGHPAPEPGTVRLFTRADRVGRRRGVSHRAAVVAAKPGAVGAVRGGDRQAPSLCVRWLSSRSRPQVTSSECSGIAFDHEREFPEDERSFLHGDRRTDRAGPGPGPALRGAERDRSRSAAEPDPADPPGGPGLRMVGRATERQATRTRQAATSTICSARATGTCS